jgi:hypothetical protein
MRIGTSLLLIAIGAILTFAVSVDAEGFNINTVGWILMAVGAAGLIISLVLMSMDRDRRVVHEVPVRDRDVYR